MWLLTVTSMLIAIGGACGGVGASGTAELIVGAASSMEPLFSELGPAFERQTGAKVTFVYGSSGSLTVQIEQGAPLDAFASADLSYVTRLMDQGLVLSNQGGHIAEGRLVALTTLELAEGATWRDAIIDGRARYIAIANPEVAPYGKAAQTALELTGLWEVIQSRLIYGENVVQVLQFVQSGNAEVGFVALSLVASSPPEGVTMFLIDPCGHSPLPQSIVAVRNAKTAAHPELVEEFLVFMDSPSSQAILERFGYGLPMPRLNHRSVCE